MADILASASDHSSAGACTTVSPVSFRTTTISIPKKRTSCPRSTTSGRTRTPPGERVLGALAGPPRASSSRGLGVRWLHVIAGPLQAGDKALLVAFDLDPTAHRLTGDAEDPLDASRHTGKFWVALPCDITDPGRIQDHGPAGTALVIEAIGAYDPDKDRRDEHSPRRYGRRLRGPREQRLATELGKIQTALTTIVTTCPAGSWTRDGDVYTPGSVASALVKCG